MPEKKQSETAPKIPPDTRIDKIISNSLDRAFERFSLLASCYNELENAVIMQQGEYANLKRDKDLISNDTARIRENNIRHGFLSALEKFKTILPEYLDVTQPVSLLRGVSSRSEVLEEILGQRLRGRFEVVKLIKEGNSATLFLLKNLYTGRKVIANMLKMAELSDDASTEVMKVAGLKHRNVIKLIDQSLETFPFFVLCEYVDGVTLAHAIEKTGQRPLRQAVGWLYELTDAVEYLRRKEIRHFNLRPSKIYIDEEWHIMITPFDIISARKEDRTLSRFMDDCLYLAPELLYGNENPYELPASKLRAADQFSLGLIAYKILTGKDLFKSESAKEDDFTGTDSIEDIIDNRRRFFESETFRKGKLEAIPFVKLAAILERTLSEKPENRFENLHELSDEFYNLRREKDYQVSIVRRSYRDCLEINRDFIRDFYTAFLEKEPKMKLNFTSGEQQHTMLQMAVDVLIDLDSKAADLQKIISSEHHRGYPPELFGTFLETLIETVKKNDP
ncbi:MAG TPA: protein kinase, partial [Saprospiraceae bacterium]|nr:protein kinase [Saprospiraceae bacterium]